MLQPLIKIIKNFIKTIKNHNLNFLQSFRIENFIGWELCDKNTIFSYRKTSIGILSSIIAVGAEIRMTRNNSCFCYSVASDYIIFDINKNNILISKNQQKECLLRMGPAAML